MFSYLSLDFQVKTGTCFSLQDKRLFKIHVSKVKVTIVDCILWNTQDVRPSLAWHIEFVILSNNYLWILFIDRYSCGGDLDTASGYFGFRNDGGLEDIDVNCEWKIITPENSSVQLKISRLQITKTIGCTQSFLAVCISNLCTMHRENRKETKIRNRYDNQKHHREWHHKLNTTNRKSKGLFFSQIIG